jgi:hypothetical protein
MSLVTLPFNPCSDVMDPFMNSFQCHLDQALGRLVPCYDVHCLSASGAGQQTATGGLHHTAPTASALPQTMPASQDVRGLCRVLVSGAGERGQPHVAGTLLQLLGSSVNLAAVSLPQIVVAGCGDSALGCVSTVRKAAQK